MKLCNIQTENGLHLGLVSPRGIIDATKAGVKLSLDDIVAGADISALRELEENSALPTVDEPVYGKVINKPGKIVCVGLNYESHIEGIHMKRPDYPVLFSKFFDSQTPCGAAIDLPEWETSYDYEAELVIVIGKKAWNVSEAEARSCIFGYTCGNDMTCRESQTRSGQWLIGKSMPGFAPCGPCIATADSFFPEKGCAIRSYVNGELRQNGSTTDMIFSCAQVVSYASRYIVLNPGDMIFTGTPTGVALERRDLGTGWLQYGDRVDIEIEGIGTLTNTMS